MKKEFEKELKLLEELKLPENFGLFSGMQWVLLDFLIGCGIIGFIWILLSPIMGKYAIGIGLIAFLWYTGEEGIPFTKIKGNIYNFYNWKTGDLEYYKKIRQLLGLLKAKLKYLQQIQKK